MYELQRANEVKVNSDNTTRDLVLFTYVLIINPKLEYLYNYYLNYYYIMIINKINNTL